MEQENVSTNSAPSLDRYTNIPSLGHTQILPTQVIMEQATQIIPASSQTPQQIVPVQDIFKPHVQKQVVVQQPYQTGAYVTAQSQQVQQQVQQQTQQVQQQVQQQTQQVQEVQQTNSLIDDSELQKEFIGKNYDNIMNSQFNVFAALFNFLYYFYRKMYIYGISLSLIMLIVLVITRNVIVYVVLCGLVGLITNVLYRRFSLSKVQAIREDNEDKPIESIKELCRDEGNTSLASVIFGLICEMVAGVCIGILVFIFLLSKVNL